MTGLLICMSNNDILDTVCRYDLFRSQKLIITILLLIERERERRKTVQSGKENGIQRITDRESQRERERKKLDKSF